MSYRDDLLATPDEDLESEARRRKQRLLDTIPDVRDGLTRVERVVLWQLYLLEKELGGRSVPTAMLYGRVVDHGINLRPDELSRLLGRLGAMTRLS